MSEPILPCVEVEPQRPARASVLWLHGLGADGHDFEPIVPHLGLDDLGVRFVFPHAPSIPVTINAGFVMPAWYDIADLGSREREDTGGIRRSAERVRALLARERERGIPAERTVLAGFSQGGAIALHVGLRSRERLAGILALSTYLVDADGLGEDASETSRATPIFIAHGEHDPMVPVALGRAAYERLHELDYEVEWKTYPMQHAVCPDEIERVGAWLRERLADDGTG